MTAISVIMELANLSKRRKSTAEELSAATPSPTNSRIPGAAWTQLSHNFGGEQQWRTGPDGSILELRKEKSRDAARSRRGKENYEFYELAKMLPLPGAITSQLDKASIIRLTISYLKLREFTVHGDPPWPREASTANKGLKGGSLRHRSLAHFSLDMFEHHQGTHILQSLDGFAFALTSDARFLYISETVSIYLGLSQVEMTGSSVFDYIHQEDHQELADQLCLTLATGQPMPSPSSVTSEDGSGGSQSTMNMDVASCMAINNNSPFKGYDRTFCIRMKSTLSKRGCHFKSSGYRVVLVLGHLRPQYVFSHTRKSSPILIGMVALAIALPPPSVHEVRLESDMFVTRLTFDFRIAHCEPKVSDLLDYTADELQGRSLYSLCHGQDAAKIKKTHVDLLKRGQVMSPYFRLLNKNGGYCWMQTCATIICNSKNGEEQNIICVNYVISRNNYENIIFDQSQMDPALANMKNDDSEYANPATPEAQRNGDGSEVVGGDDNRKSPPGGMGSSASPRTTPENITSLRDTPTGSLGKTLIKAETIGGNLPPMTSSELHDEAQSGLDVSSSPGRVSAPPSSTPGTPHTRATPGVTPVPIGLSGTLDNSPRNNKMEEGSVRDLEAAMTRHLPEEPCTDFSTDALLKGGTSTGTTSGQRTIQWVGGATGQQTPLPASTLLRQLYANRESVIRSSVQRSSYYSDVQSALPTPPGSEGYQELFSKSHDFPFTSGAVSSAAASLSAGSTFSEYHAAMTPPSSVSPREKMNNECGELRPNVGFLQEANGGVPTQPLPLKPQVYSYGSGGMSLETPSYSAPLGDQSGLYTPGGFHLYHSNSAKSPAYDSLRSGGSWYTPS